jgi:hypothetical protein
VPSEIREDTSLQAIRRTPTGSGGGRWYSALALCFTVSRAVYFLMGARPDLSPIDTYLQYLDPMLLREHLWQSLFYLREQPPGFNLYLGLVLKTAARPEAVFFVIHLLLGLALCFSLMAVMRSLGMAHWLAFLLAALFTASPITVLYENWVFYTYPVMAALTVAAWSMGRYIRTVKFGDALIYFVSLAVVASVRGVFHLSWFLLLATSLIWATRNHWKRGLCALAAPALLITGVYVKNYVMFGDIIPGQVYRKINYADMVAQQAPPEVLARLESEGKISGILERDYDDDTPQFAEFVKQPPPTGIPLLDMPMKTTGQSNWNSLWTAKIADLYYHDAQIVTREYPGLFWKQVRANVRGYLLPASDAFPFDRVASAARLRPFLTWYERVTGGELYVNPDPSADDVPMAWLNVLLFPACLVGGVVFMARLAKNRGWTAETRARAATVVFLLFNITYDSAITILFAAGDHNRYREEVAPFYLVLSGLLLNAAWVRFRSGRRRLAAVPSVAG